MGGGSQCLVASVRQPYTGRLSEQHKLFEPALLGEKKLLPGGFNESAVRLNYYVRNQGAVDGRPNEERGTIFARRALEIWPYPQVDMGLVRDKDVAELRAQSSLRDASSLAMSADVREVLEALQESICTLGDTIAVIENRSVCYYDGSGAFFAECCLWLITSGFSFPSHSTRWMIPMDWQET